jgi:hypothetical protein
MTTLLDAFTMAIFLSQALIASRLVGFWLVGKGPVSIPSGFR